MTVTFSGPEFSKTGGKLSASAHMVARVIEDGVQTDKIRGAFTMNDNGTWQFAPGFPAEITVPPDVLAAIDAAVSAAVEEFGIEHPAPAPEEPEDRSETGNFLAKQQIRSLLERGNTAEALELMLGLIP